MAKNGPVLIRPATPEELKRLRPRARGRGGVKAKNQIGDLRPMFGKEYVAFKGGEGGRGWSVTATIC